MGSFTIYVWSLCLCLRHCSRLKHFHTFSYIFNVHTVHTVHTYEISVTCLLHLVASQGFIMNSLFHHNLMFLIMFQLCLHEGRRGPQFVGQKAEHRGVLRHAGQAEAQIHQQHLISSRCQVQKFCRNRKNLKKNALTKFLKMNKTSNYNKYKTSFLDKYKTCHVLIPH